MTFKDCVWVSNWDIDISTFDIFSLPSNVFIYSSSPHDNAVGTLLESVWGQSMQWFSLNPRRQVMLAIPACPSLLGGNAHRRSSL